MLIPEGLAEGPIGLSFGDRYQINSWNAAGQLVAVDNDLQAPPTTYNPSGLRKSKNDGLESSPELRTLCS